MTPTFETSNTPGYRQARAGLELAAAVLYERFAALVGRGDATRRDREFRRLAEECRRKASREGEVR